MKISLKSVLLAISSLLCLLLLTACYADNWTPKGEEVTLIAKGEPAKYCCIFEADDQTAEGGALLFKSKLTSNGLKCVPSVVSHTSDKSELEILFGKTDRIASKTAANLLESGIAENKDSLHWVFYYRQGKLAIVASDEDSYDFAVNVFFDKYLTDSGIVFEDTLKEHFSASVEEYDRYIAEQERLVAEEKKKEHEGALDELEALLEAQRNELSTIQGTWNKYASVSSSNPKLYLFRDYTENMSAIADVKWNAPHAYPTEDEHPRLLLTKDNLPLVRKMLRKDDATNATFKDLAETQIFSNGILPPASNQGINATVNAIEFHNYDENYLSVIQAKALSYLLYGDKYYGYQALLYMKNYLKSLDIKQIPSDQCRQYGYVTYTAALVYDWCYDLLTETDKVQLIAGVENCLLRGKNNYSLKMEVDFPPQKQVAIAGHGNEYQILRDYLAFSVAIYDEVPSWYEYVGGRVYNDFLPARNYLYQSGTLWQGTGYARTRHAPTLYSAWILQIATGENPYDNVLHTAVQGIFNYEVTPGYTFSDGDKTGDLWDAANNVSLAYMAAYLYKDPAMLSMATYVMGKSSFDSDLGGLNATSYVVMRGLCALKPGEDRYANMDLIQYNGAYVGQYIVREAWDDESSAAVFMKIKERTTSGHEHMDSGTFEIYYKGMLTSDGGCYDNDAHRHSMYYHDATISHNGLIIYNPSLKNTEGRYYSGGQRRPPSTNKMPLDEWLADDRMDTGKVIGRQHGYADEAEAQPLYAYIAGDITKAYDATTVSYVGRRMLTVYTGDADFPMVFFVYDDVESLNASYKKSFLLQITSSEAPTITGNKIITENGEGRLVLTSLSSNVKFASYGGREYNANGSYNCAKSSNYLINGSQLATLNGEDDGHWGRIEIISTTGTKQTTFMNLLYVTDKGSDRSSDVTKITNANGVEGAVFNKKIAAIFATDRDGAKNAVYCQVTGGKRVDYYVSGVAAGEWKVTVDGKDCGTYTATAEGGLLTFAAPAGGVIITPVNLLG